MDRAYTNLLALLHKTSPSLPLTTIEGALAHYLAHISPLPTPLAASAVSSALYLAQPFTNDKLQSFLTAFRHATHLRYQKQKDETENRSTLGNLFSKSLNAAISQWVDDIIKGIQGGHPVLRLSSLSGLLLGLNDLEAEPQKGPADETITRSFYLGSSRNIVEGELILAVAEVIDTYSYGLRSAFSSEWEKELQSASRVILTLSLIIASQSLPLVSQARFNVLPLPTLNHLILITLSSTFHHGKFAQELQDSVIQQGEYSVFIPEASPVARTLHSINVSPVFTSAAPLSRLAATCLRSRLESYSDYRKAEGLRAASETLQLLQEMASQVEQDWNTAPLAVVGERNIAPDSRPITKAVWSVLKTMLFSTIMLADVILTSVVYIQPNSAPYVQTSSNPSGLALVVLQILSHFAFVISQFGGVTSTSQGFDHLKKTFYLALDILTQENAGRHDNDSLASQYVKDQCLALNSPANARVPRTVQDAKKALVLASVEQLVPNLTEESIRDHVFDLCWPHLSDPSHRETFESAHSVILAVFASHAQHQQRWTELNEKFPISDETGLISNNFESSGFVKKMVPFYAGCLIEKEIHLSCFGRQLPQLPQLGSTYRVVPYRIVSHMTKLPSFVERHHHHHFVFALADDGTDIIAVVRMLTTLNIFQQNSADGGLSTPQLRMAYAALVRCASTSRLSVDTTPEEAFSLSWYCVRLLLDAIHSDRLGKNKGKEEINTSSPVAMSKEHLHRLHLALISTVSSLPLALMFRVLEEIKMIIISTQSSFETTSGAPPTSSVPHGLGGEEKGEAESTRDELVKALFEEIMGQVGFKEKSATMRWWYKNRMDLQASSKDRVTPSDMAKT